jgi:hypothetical protein
MLKADPKYGPFTSANAAEFRATLYRILFDTFFDELHVSESFNAQSTTSLFNVYQDRKLNFLKCFEEASQVGVNFTDPFLPLFFFLENCFDVASAKYLLNLVIACYKNLHSEHSLNLNIRHTEIIKSDVVFLDACKFIRVANKFVNAQVHIDLVFSHDSLLKFPDVDRKGIQNQEAFRKRLSFLSRPFFFYVVLSILEHVGLYNYRPFELIGYNCKDKPTPEDAPKEWNMINFFTNCLESSLRSSEKLRFLKQIGTSLFKCICDKKFPCSYDDFKRNQLHLQVIDYFNYICSQKECVNSFFGKLGKTISVAAIAPKVTNALSNAYTVNAKRRKKSSKVTKKAHKKALEDALAVIHDKGKRDDLFDPDTDESDPENKQDGTTAEKEAIGADDDGDSTTTSKDHDGVSRPELSDDKSDDDHVFSKKQVSSADIKKQMYVVNFSYTEENDMAACGKCSYGANIQSNVPFGSITITVASGEKKNISYLCILHAANYWNQYQSDSRYQIDYTDHKTSDLEVPFNTLSSLKNRLQRMALTMETVEGELKKFFYISSNHMSKRMADLLRKSNEDYAGSCQCYSTYSSNDAAAPPNGLCFSNGFSCHNFSSRQECDLTCNFGNCGNQRIMQLRSSLDLSSFSIRPVENTGFGLHCSGRTYNVGDVIIEFVGDVITESTLQQRIKKKVNANTTSGEEIKLYMMDLGIPGYFLDSEKKGNYSRFINHSCEPNCMLQKWLVCFFFLASFILFYFMLYLFLFFCSPVPPVHLGQPFTMCCCYRYSSY